MDCTVGVLLPDEQDKHMEKRAATAFLVVGQRATTKEERKWGYRNALRAGEKESGKDSMYIQLWRISWMRNR